MRKRIREFKNVFNKLTKAFKIMSVQFGKSFL